MRRWMVSMLLVCTATCDRGETEAFRPLAAGDAAPAYAAPALTGDTVALTSLRGRPVLLNLWATWCPPCREEMPALQELQERYGSQGLEVVAVSLDQSADAAAAFVDPTVNRVVATVAELGLTMSVLHDGTGRVTHTFRTTGVPETFLIDADGRIVRRWIGAFDPLADDVIALVEQTLTSRAR